MTLPMIGIRFCDNDFNSTVSSFMELLKEIQFVPTKSQIVTMFNETAYGLYLMFQNKFRYVDSDPSHIKQYLQIKESDVFIGIEAWEWFDVCPYGFEHDYYLLQNGQLSIH